MQKSSAIIQEGLALRSKSGTKGWICVSCNHVMSFLDFSGGCPNCTSKRIHPIKSPERLHEETEAAKETQRFHYWQPEAFNPQSWESQMGKALTSAQVLTLLQKFIPGTKMFPQLNPILGRRLMAYYVPYHPKPEEKAILSPTEVKGQLKFICCGEPGIMPEWDVLPLDEDKKSLPQIRGWRSILGIFYRLGLIPFVPDEGTRLGWWQIRESPFKERANA